MAKEKIDLKGKSDRELIEMQVELLQKQTGYINKIEGYHLFYFLMIIIALLFWFFR